MRIVQYETGQLRAHLAREPARSFPFLTDGEGLYLVEDWRADRAHPKHLRARRLSKAEQSLVVGALRDAAEEAAYRVAVPTSALSVRARRARPVRP